MDEDSFEPAGRERTAEVTVDTVSRRLLESYLPVIDELSGQIGQLETDIEREAAELSETQLHDDPRRELLLRIAHRG